MSVSGFWDELYRRNRPVVGLSPMDGVTDAPFRYMVAKYGSVHTQHEESPHTGYAGGGVDVIFTEFVSVDGLHYATGDKRERLLQAFIRARDVGELHTQHEESPHTGYAGDKPWPYEIAQVFGHTPAFFAEAAEIIERLGFDGVDINMGCPAHKVEEHGSGAGLIRTPALAQEIVRVTKAATKLPVSVKTRIGVDRDEATEWMEALCEVRPATISLHGRTLKQLYQGKADWEAIGRAADVTHRHGGHILGNGDIQSFSEGMEKVKAYGVDGFLIGRAAEGNPGVFLSSGIPLENAKREQRLAWAVEHARVYEAVFGAGNFMPMRKHLAWYAHGFPGASELRQRLMTVNSAGEVAEILDHDHSD